ncbi:phosphotransferase system, enzyme I, PtsI [Malonomonas rubra DSM 5091]|uniref:phosphoenolpyruvate--protein phosphotransferase n=1 Tax=Malonomonas rubra DSM 5091 TaxID=1122189 RepID=A0A1M6LFX7_MALRU|nr:phosphoenolpyruvate--protein phosphotransferase [Malonomonas rubra]SHJ70090.1 phosphotransferase system, enzyme I, PtsI [Malonomonas rubra DSM 5091]
MENSLSILKEIVQKAASAESVETQMTYIVSAVRSAMKVSVCSLYIADTDGGLVLAATDGLASVAVGNVKLSAGEGLVGLVASSSHPVSTDNAAEHPAYRYFPETGEEQYQAFLGVPLVHLRQLIGVLVIQEQEKRIFSSDEEAFLVTVAAQLAATLFLERDRHPADEPDLQPDDMQRLKGVKGAPGIAIGSIYLISGNDLSEVADKECSDSSLELERFHTALQQCRDQLEQGSLSFGDQLSGEVASIFSVYHMLLNSRELISSVEAAVRNGSWAPGALRETVTDLSTRFEQMDDPYLRLRAEDVRNIGNKIYASMNGAEPAVSEQQNLILAGDLISIADIARFKPGQLAGIICRAGSALSHTAVLANALGLPAVMGGGKLKRWQQGALAIVDGHQGEVILNPSPQVLAEYRNLADRERNLFAGLEELRDLPALTPDGFRIKLYANTGLMADISPGLKHGAEGVGLYRSEIPFMEHDHFPTEEQQLQTYRQVLKAYAGKPVTIRTLDIGGDKLLPYFRFSEENPYLGWRGIRFTLDNRPIFMTQLRAFLRAAEGLHNLKILLPMVSRVDELEAFMQLLDDACAQLDGEGIDIEKPPVGIMVEVPAAVNLLPFLAKRIDFVSIGSNDLAQYLLALDRNNSRVSHMFDNLHPAMLREVYRIVTECRKFDLPLSLCGEMAADPLAVVLLLGMRIEALSMSAYSLPKIKWLIRTLPAEVAEQTLQEALLLEHENLVRDLVKRVLGQYNLAALFR